MLKLFFTYLIGTGIIVPMEEQNDNRDLYVLYVVKHEKAELFAYEHCYEEEILEYIDSGDFEYNECLGFNNGEFFDRCESPLTKNK